MPFPTTPILDSGAGVDANPIAGNWSGPIYPGLGQLRRLSNQIVWSGTTSGSWWNPTTFGPDCETYATINTLGTDGNLILLYARAQNLNTTSLDGYVVYLNLLSGADHFRIARETDGSDTDIDSDDTITWAVGDSIGIACIGTNIQGWRKPAAGAWTQVLDATDATYAAAGSLAALVDSATFGLSNVGGGTIGAAAPSPIDVSYPPRKFGPF